MVIIQLEEIVRRLGLRVFRIQYINIHNWCYSNPFYYHNQSQWDSTRLKIFLLSTLIYTHLLQKDKYIHVNIHLTICMYEDVYASPTYNVRGTYAHHGHCLLDNINVHLQTAVLHGPPSASERKRDSEDPVSSLTGRSAVLQSLLVRVRTPMCQSLYTKVA